MTLVLPNTGLISRDLVELRKKIGGLKAEKKEYVLFPVKSAKDLMLKLRNAADELEMPLAGAVVAQTVHNLEPVDIVDKKGNVGKYFLVHCVATLRFMSRDGSYVDVVGSGNGGGNDDKSGGKASTYAWKDAVVKALSLPDDEMVDTDDEDVKLVAAKKSVGKSRKVVESSVVKPSLETVVDAFKNATNENMIAEVKELIKFRKDWSAMDQEAISFAFNAAKGRLQ